MIFQKLLNLHITCGRW